MPYRSLPHRLLAVALVISAASLSSCGSAQPTRVRISDLAWLAGTWVGPGQSDFTIEQRWSEPRAGSISGTHIARIGEEVRVRGELRIVGGERGVVLLGSPEGRLPSNYPLREFRHQFVQFSNASPSAEPPQLCQFERSGDELLVRFESIDPLGTKRNVDYRLQRTGPPPEWQAGF